MKILNNGDLKVLNDLLESVLNYTQKDQIEIVRNNSAFSEEYGMALKNIKELNQHKVNIVQLIKYLNKEGSQNV